MDEDLARLHYANLYLRNTVPDGEPGQDALKGVQERGPLADLYFSRENIGAVMSATRALVYRQADYLVGEQSKEQLLWVMRSIYLQYADNREGDLRAQVRRLNARVLDYTVPNIISNVSMHKRFLSMVDRNPVPPSRGVSTSTTRQLEFARP